MESIYNYEELRSKEIFSVAGLDLIVFNGVTLFDVTQLHLHEYDHEFIGVRILVRENEIGNLSIYPNQSLSVDEKQGIFTVKTKK